MIKIRNLVGAITFALLVLASGCHASNPGPGSSSAQTLQSTLDSWRSRADVPATVLGVST